MAATRRESCGDGEGGGPWLRQGAAATGVGPDLGGDSEGELRRRGGRRTLVATGRAADLGGDGERRRRGGSRTLVARESGGDGGGWTLAATFAVS